MVLAEWQVWSKASEEALTRLIEKELSYSVSHKAGPVCHLSLYLHHLAQYLMQ